MATKHWVRDLLLTDTTNYTSSDNQPMCDLILFHWLRTAGWTWLWECDGEVGPHALHPNHVQDGNMEEVGTTKYTSVGGAALSKETTGVVTGSQRLKVAAGGAGQGVQTLAMSTMKARSTQSTGLSWTLTGPVNGFMTLYTGSGGLAASQEMIGSYLTLSGSSQPTNNGSFRIAHLGGTDWNDTTRFVFYNPAGVAEGYLPGPPPYYITTTVVRRYELVVFAANAGAAWDVRVDPGTGSFASIGSIPNNGGTATVYRFAFNVTGAGSVYLQLLAPGTGTLYVEGINCFRSFFERGVWAEGENTGVLTNPDRFSVSGGGFTPNGHVIGMHLFVWDPTNPKNSGAYEIIADLGGGVVQVNLRSTTFAFTSQSGLRWRIAPVLWEQQGYDWKHSAGFGLQSPHASGWRLFLRQNWSNSQSAKNMQFWAAPEDADFDFSNGHFWTTGPNVGMSCMRNRCGTWTRNVSGGGTTPLMHGWLGEKSYTTADTTSRLFIMTDEDASFVSLANIDTVDNQNHGGFAVGFTRETPPASMEAFETFALFGAWEDITASTTFYFDDNAYRIGYTPTMFGSDGIAVAGTVLQLGIGASTVEPETQSLAKANPWDSREWVRPWILLRDRAMVNGQVAVWQADFGHFQGRANMTDVTTFDSHAYLHLDNGVVWEWCGEALSA